MPLSPSPLQVFAQAYDNPIPGYNTKTVGNLRLFEALAEHEFQLDYFNEGDFAKVRWRIGYRSLGYWCACRLVMLPN